MSLTINTDLSMVRVYDIVPPGAITSDRDCVIIPAFLPIAGEVEEEERYLRDSQAYYDRCYEEGCYASHYFQLRQFERLENGWIRLR